MSETLPIRFEEHLQLTNLGIKASSIKFSTVSMESERYVCVEEDITGFPHVAIVDLQDKEKVIRKKIPGEHVLMSSASRLMAVRYKIDDSTLIEIYDADLRVKLKSYKMRSEVVFWRWVSAGTLGMVTLSSVLHWTGDGGGTGPVEVFDRCSAMGSFQVIDYKAGPDLEWLVLVGLSAEMGRVVGKLQLYSTERRCSQLIDGHTACFARFRLRGNTEDSNLVCFTNCQQRQTKLHIVEVGRPHPGNKPFLKKNVDTFFAHEAVNDFPVALQSSVKYGVLYLITKYGYLHLYDLETATCIYVNRISADTIFVTTPYESKGGIIGVNRKGQILSVTLDETQIIPYIKNVLQNTDLALNFSARNHLEGAEELFIIKFNSHFDNREYTDAANLAAIAPGGILRTTQTIQKFQQAPLNPGKISPLLEYFGILMDNGQLNRFESLEICRPVLLQGKKEIMEKWLIHNKLECTEELGDLARTVDTNLALTIYLRASVPNKVVECFAHSGNFEKIIQYSAKVNYTPDYICLLRNTLLTCPDKGLEFAKVLLRDGNPVVGIRQIVNVFSERSMIQECTAFLLDALKNNLPDEGDMQTKLLEMNLLYAPQVADAILGNRMFSYYDRSQIASLCEKSGLFKRALEHFTDVEDITRVIVCTDSIEPDWLVEYFGTLCVENSLLCLKTLLMASKQNLNVCLQVVIKYYHQLTVDAVVKLFESLNSSEGLFCFLGSIIHDNRDEELHFKYIKAACELGQIGVVETVCRNSNNFCPEKVKNYLKEVQIADYLPLLIVCDRFNFIHDLIFFLYSNKQQKYLEIFVKSVNPSRLPAVVGELMDLDCSEDFIKHLIKEVKGVFSTEELVNVVEKRNRLQILLPWLEDKAQNGCFEVATHNTLAKIYINNNTNPEGFLKENGAYDSQVIGKYCESRNPLLACIAYERGHCDSQLLQLYKDNMFYKQAAKFLVSRKNSDLWALALSEEDTFRKNVVDQIVHSTLVESRDPAEISETVKAFIAAGLLNDLIRLLDKLISENPSCSEESNLQNLIILTAMKVDKSRVMEFIKKFKNYSAEEIANIAVNNELYDEALLIYRTFNMNDLALNVLTKYLDNVERGQKLAEQCNESTVWCSLGEAQLHRGLVKDAIASFLKAGNPSSLERVIKAAQTTGEWEDLVGYLQMAAKKTRSPFVESELIYAFAMTGRLKELEEFISIPNNADINKIGDRCFECKLYESAKLLYNNCSNFSRLAVTLISLNEFQGSVESARKANKMETWKEVCFACLENREFRFAQICALNIIVNAEELDSLIQYYEERGYFEEILSVMEIGLSQERSHMGMFTQLAILYAKYKTEKMKDHLEMFWSRINIPKVVRAAEEAHLWQELVLLHEKYEHYDNAATVMMEHPTETWKEGYFTDIILKVSNHRLHLKAVQFYLEFKPLILNNFLTTLSHKLDNPKVVAFISEAGRLELVKPYLHTVQFLNDKIINEALNNLLIKEEDFQGLRTSIDSYDNFDARCMAQRLKENDLMEFRRIAVLLYKRTKLWDESIKLGLENGLFADALEAAAESKCPKTAESLLEQFVLESKLDWFAACLFQCYDLLRPDVVLELAWSHNIMDLAMPYMIQITREYIFKVDRLMEARCQADQVAPSLKTQPSIQNLPFYTSSKDGPTTQWK